MEHLTSGPKCHNGKVVGKRKVNSTLVMFVGIYTFVFEDLFLQWLEGIPSLSSSDATFELVPVMACVVRAKVFVFVHHLNSEWSKERGTYLNNGEGLTVERLASNK